MPESKDIDHQAPGTVKAVTIRLLEENRENLDDPSDKYAQGYHDALVDVMKDLGIAVPPEHDGHYD